MAEAEVEDDGAHTAEQGSSQKPSVRPREGSPQRSPRGVREGSPGDEAVGNAFAIAGALADDLVPDSAEQVRPHQIFRLC